MRTEKRFENWKRRDLGPFFDPDIIVVTTTNENFDIVPIITPFQVKSYFNL